MELSVIWNSFFMIFGLIAGLVESFPMDVDSIKDGIQMGLMTGAGMAMDLADKAKIQGSSDTKIKAGTFELEKKHQFKAGGGDEDDEDEDRKRRRRSVVNTEEKPSAVFRPKRSPCFARRRAQQTTTTTTTEVANPDDPRRRRKRSPQDYENQNDIDQTVIPDQNTFAERAQDIGERFRQLIKGVLDSLAGAFEKLRRSIQSESNTKSSYEMH